MRTVLERRDKTLLTVRKYLGRNFSWGSCDCGKIAAFHARKFGWKPPKTGTYKSAKGAVSYLETLGVESLPDLLDKIGMKRIAPAFAMQGDFFSFASDHQIGAIGIYLGNGKMLAFHETSPALVVIEVNMSAIERAWSIDG